jgi:diguanylate cyclase (GGDEF)-like protein
MEIPQFVSTQVANAIARRQSEEELKFSSTHDVLTGLYNRAYFEEEIHRLSTGRISPVGVIMLDVDGLKKTNDALGHAAGDELLVRASGILRSAFRTNDVVARVGGDEFAVLLPLSNAVSVRKSIERINQITIKENSKNNRTTVSFSIGSADVEDVRQLVEGIKTADANMYADKQAKKNSRQTN